MSEGGGGGHGAVSFNDPRTLNRALSVKEVIQTIGNNKKNAELLQILQDMDKNSDGTIDVAELVNVLQDVNRNRRDRKYLLIAVVAMFLFGLILIGTIIGLTYAMLYALKDTEVKGNTMYTKNSDGAVADIIRTGSAEFGVANDALVNRLANTTSANSTLPVLRTAAFMGTPQALHSEIDVETLLELKYLMIRGAGKVELGLAVHGVARIPLDGSVHGTVVRVVTTAGTVTLDGTIVTFSSAIADIFTEAGFRVSGGRRALLGMYSVLGFFSSVKDLSAAGLPAGQSGPKLPSENFVMRIKFYEPCVISLRPDVDRCKYAPPEVPTYQDPSPPPPSPMDASPPMPPTSESATQPPMLAAMPPPAPAVANATAHRLALEASLADVFDAIDDAPARRRLRHRYVATAGPIANADGRILKDDPEPALVDLAGVEEYMGVRYMTHYETTYSFGGAIRVMYEFALYPSFQKIDVTTNDRTTVYTWQEQVISKDGNSTVTTYWCKNTTISSPGASGFNASSVLNYTYLGLDTLGDTLARRFELFVLQPSSMNRDGVLRIDYWDALDNTPLRLEFQNSDIGTLMMEFVEVRSIAASSPEAAPKLYVSPALDTCPMDNSLPLLSTPFTISGEVTTYAEPLATTTLNTTSAARRLAESYVMAREWEALDHVNGTGDWPQWALDMYGEAHPAHRRVALAERRELGECGYYIPFSLPMETCSGYGRLYQTRDVAASFSCDGKVGPFEISGSIAGDTCDGTIQGCVSLGLSLGIDNWLVKYLMTSASLPTSLQLASVCVGYNYRQKYIFLYGEIGPNLVILKATVSVELDISSCCTWISYVRLEAKAGFSAFGLVEYWYTFASVDLVSNYYLKGSADEEAKVKVPEATNRIGWYSIHDGYWGGWYDPVWPCSKASFDANGKTQVVAYPMNSYHIRLEGDLGGGDDTAMNGLAVGCLSGTAELVEAGLWGGWTSTATCPPGGYFVGAKMRVEAPDGDDSAANTIVFKCSNQRNVDTSVFDGFWGDWTSYRDCPGDTYICGLQVRFEEDQSGGDDTALNGIRMACCSFPSSGTSIVSQSTTIATGTNGWSSCLDLTNGNQGWGTYLQQYQCWNNNAPSQTFTAKTTGLGTYILVSASGLCFTVENGATNAGARVRLETCQGLRHQQFAVTPLAADFRYTFAPAHANGMCLDIWGAQANNGAALALYQCTGSNNQMFGFNLPYNAIGNKPIYTSMGDNLCWDVVNAATWIANTPIQQNNCGKNNPAQQFTIVSMGTNAYQIKTSAGYCLGIQDARTDWYAPLVVQQCVGHARHQTFRTRVAFEGGVALSPFHNPNMCIDVLAASRSPGARLIQYDCHFQAHQAHKLQLPV